MSKYRNRAGARRANNSGYLLLPRLAAQVQSIAATGEGTPEAATVVTLLVLGSGIRIIESTSLSVLSGVALTSYVDGSGAYNDCSSLADGGAVAGGRLAVMTFPGASDLSQQWALAWPSNSTLIKSPRGSTLGGVIGPDQDIGSIPMGKVYFGPNDGGLVARPGQMPVSGAVLYSGDTYEFSVLTGASVLELEPGAATWSVTLEGSGASVPIDSVSAGAFRLDFSAVGPVTGQTLVLSSYNPWIRGSGGEFVAPSVISLP